MGAAPPGNGQLQHLLQSAVQAVDWTYSIFWQFCPQQGVLVWSEGYYNGPIKTRKTVQPMELSAEEASLHRSQQLRELYDSLSAGETSQPLRRAALSPEDLTESEWFYLMCVSFSFSPAVGLPGKAYVKRQHVWLTGAHEADSKVFSRAILAKTVLCIPVMDGVVELGSTERIQEDPRLIPQVKAFFVDHRHPPPKPALSGHSTSNPAASSSPFPAASIYRVATNPSNLNRVTHQAADHDDEDDNDEDVTNAEESGAESDSEAETDRNSRQTSEAGPPNQAHTAAAEPSELMQLEMSDNIRIGSPDDASNHMDSEFPVVLSGGGGAGVKKSASSLSGHRARAESSRRWPVLQHQQLVQPPPQPLFLTGAPLLEELAQDDTHYSQTVSSILQHQVTRWTSESYPGGGGPTAQSAFSKWSFRSDHQFHVPPDRTSQWLLKYILLTVPYLHTKYNNDENLPKTEGPGSADQTSRLRGKGGAAQQDELSANHVLAERRRREKLNERFIVLRSLVPFVTKMDKASILGDTIEYLKQLRRKIQDLEASSRQMETERARLIEATKSNSGSGKDPQSGVTMADRARNGLGQGPDKRKVRVVEGIGGGAKAKMVEASPDMLQVSIIESDALIELQCPYKEGVLLELMLTLREMLVEVTAVQSSLNNGFFTAELRAKVKENVNGKKASIIEVKRAINQIVPHTHVNNGGDSQFSNLKDRWISCAHLSWCTRFRKRYLVRESTNQNPALHDIGDFSLVKLNSDEHTIQNHLVYHLSHRKS
ncbi:hypothetical protein V2J09_009224 [Rumex salicifolius]